MFISKFESTKSQQHSGKKKRKTRIFVKIIFFLNTDLEFPNIFEIIFNYLMVLEEGLVQFNEMFITDQNDNRVPQPNGNGH